MSGYPPRDGVHPRPDRDLGLAEVEPDDQQQAAIDELLDQGLDPDLLWED